jgi:hypothetical protein
MSQTETALNDLDKIATLLVRFRAIEVMYDLSEHPEERFVAPPQIKELHVQLRDHTINLYTQILEYQIDAINHFSHSKLRRTAKNVASPSRRSVSDIETTADSASLTLQILDSGAMGSLGPQLSSLREDFKETLDRMAEINTNVLVRGRWPNQSTIFLLAHHNEGYFENQAHPRPSSSGMRSFQ